MQNRSAGIIAFQNHLPHNSVWGLWWYPEKHLVIGRIFLYETD